MKIFKTRWQPSLLSGPVACDVKGGRGESRSPVAIVSEGHVDLRCFLLWGQLKKYHALRTCVPTTLRG
eukprot:762509-Hanusia_phi.AAC.12